MADESGTTGAPEHTDLQQTDPQQTDPKALAKQRFRAALDRKQAGGHAGADGARNDGAVHGPEVTASGRRSFRRKTG